MESIHVFYVMSSNDSVVIGRTNNFKRRLGAYRTHNPSIVLVKLLNFNTAEQVAECEEFVLNTLATQYNIKPNHNREWFDACHLQTILNVSKKGRGYILQREGFCEAK